MDLEKNSDLEKTDLQNKLDKIRDLLRNKKVMVAFSGGADSTLVAQLVREVAAESLAVTIDNGVLPSDCISNAAKIAHKIGIVHHTLRENFLKNPSFKSNPPERCYICKNIMYQMLEDHLQQESYEILVDGTNISDLLEDRPGTMVNYQKNILSPLVYAGLTVEEVKTALKILKLDYSTSTTCLATRISTGTEITPKKINRINYAENLIKNLTGVDVVRVRDEHGRALIEVHPVHKLLDDRILSHIDSELKAVGFRRVNLDIGGYGDSKEDMMVYKPCKDVKNKIMFETELPYRINVEETCKQLQKLAPVKCSLEMGIIMLELAGRNLTIFEKGKIVARRVEDNHDAQELLIEVLPHIRRIL